MKVINPSTINCKTVATIGFFDGVHAGHRFLIHQLKQLALQRNEPAMVITFPVHPRKVLHDTYVPQLLTTFEEKMNRLSTTEADYILPLDFTRELSQLSAEEFIKRILVDKLSVNCLLIGYDHRFGKNRTDDFDEYVNYGKKYGLEVIQSNAYTIDEKQISSSYIRGLLQQGNIKEANKYLTYHFKIEGIVVSGRKIGHSIGFPTANLQPNDKEKMLPTIGVYAVWVWFEGNRYGGMLNVGYNPTVSAEYRLSIEVNIFDFNKDIYGKSLTVEFVDYIRSEVKLNGLAELKEQLNADKKAVLKTLDCC